MTLGLVTAGNAVAGVPPWMAVIALIGLAAAGIWLLLVRRTRVS